MSVEPARVLCGDMREVLRTLPAESVHAVVTDPPYGLEFMGKQWDQQVPGPDYWREVLRVLKPGGHVLAFGGTRTAHRLACAIEDAGFELRDCLSWLYGSGFPKSHDISKAIDREAGAVREVVGRAKGAASSDTAALGVFAPEYDATAPATEAARAWDGWGTALKPAWEPVYLARKPFRGSVASNVCEHGCGALNIDGCRIGTTTRTNASAARHARSTMQQGMVSGTVSAEHDYGRWPANLVLDEEAAWLLDASVGELRNGGQNATSDRVSVSAAHGTYAPGKPTAYAGDRGGPSRYFYTAKASRSEREAGLERFEQRSGSDVTGRKPGSAGAQSAYAGTTESARRNVHPTVKPVALMRWLVRLITPPGGIVLDPFTGSGSTGVAAVLEGARFIGCELSREYAQLARARIAHAADEDDDQLALFERAELKPVAKAQPSQASFLWADEQEL